MQGVKDTNKVSARLRDARSEGHQQFVYRTLKHGDVPVPLFLKVRNGILYVAGSHGINEGLATAMRDELENLEAEYKYEFNRLVLDRNFLSDHVFSLMLAGLKRRPEFRCLVSVSNELGVESCEEMAELMRPKKPVERLPELSELTLISNKVAATGFDMLLEALRTAIGLRRLTLQNLSISNRQQVVLCSILKGSHLMSLDLSWTKMPAYIIDKYLFPALEKNKTLEYLNLSHIKMSS